ncbi:putative hotdog family 3-hydroxylacyl-ACP dehydratase [Cricetibacter osteomyelitidis]|uniref:Putative hotdog family 3-hydroxylacyl-ACP dehydratase n=1 Tax=Cricetibacter osteomyelitidis TaxID=1521931 RepID=A0A4R2SZE3_9PAST|nr:thioester dehydrase [Cricetibacter osteomyelitidis]TCP94905.1 putative hotdog family 3-hydroxylacyl-ACP dehydratase [Cricetibacter osteomyelitidis]
MQLPIINVAKLLPHSGEMVLLDEITHYDENNLTAYANITEQHIFVQNQRLPMYIAIEIMAQGVAAWSGCHSTDRGEPIKLGFLLGSRKYELFCESLPINCKVQIKVESSLQDSNGFGVFNATMHWISGEKPIDLPADHLLARATLSVYSPNNLEDLPQK